MEGEKHSPSHTHFSGLLVRTGDFGQEELTGYCKSRVIWLAEIQVPCSPLCPKKVKGQRPVPRLRLRSVPPAPGVKACVNQG